jgi:putative oxidoreductase
MIEKLSKIGIVVARVLIVLVFFLNAVGVIDQERPQQEMITRGIPASLAPVAAWTGRAVQLLAGLALLLGFRQRLAALALAAFMVPATLIAHPFWLYLGQPELQVQLINFSKNLAIIGGLLFIASNGTESPVHQSKSGEAAA